VEDYINPNLLFVGTEFGLSFTVDGGQHWVKIRNGLPPTPIRDLEIQKRESDLAAASFGRGFFILDDYAALRQLTPQVLSSEGALFAPGRRARAFSELGYYRAQGDNLASPNPPFGAMLTYYLRDDVFAAAGAEAPRVVLQIADASGKMVRQLDASSKAGLHRLAWDLRETPPPNAQGGGGRGRGGAAQPTGSLGVAPAGANPATPPAAGAGGQEQAAFAGLQAGRGGGGGGGGRGGRGGGAMVKPGTYTVTLGKLAAGTLVPIGQPQKVEVAPLEASNR
jgi:hypothetical protein